MKHSFFLILLLATGLVFLSGCTSDSTKIVPETQSQTPAYTQTLTPTEEQYTVTEPVLVTGDGIYSTKITVNASDPIGNTLVVTVKYDSTNQFGATGSGMVLMSTIFAYNYADVSASFNPRTKEDVIAAKIPYKNVLTTVYPNNKKSAVAKLPTDSTQGSFSPDKPYNYGAIVVIEDTIN